MGHAPQNSVADCQQRANQQAAVVDPDERRSRGFSARAPGPSSPCATMASATAGGRAGRPCEAGASAAPPRRPASAAGRISPGAGQPVEDTAYSSASRQPGGLTLATSMRRSRRAAVRQPDGDEQHPVAPHREVESGSRRRPLPALGAVGEHRGHPGVRHVRFEPHVRALDRRARRIAQRDGQRRGTDDGGRRRERPGDVQRWSVAGGPAAGAEQQARRHEQNDRKAADRRRPPASGSAAWRHAVASAARWCSGAYCEQLHTGFTVSPSGGNMW